MAQSRPVAGNEGCPKKTGWQGVGSCWEKWEARTTRGDPLRRVFWECSGLRLSGDRLEGGWRESLEE